VKDCNSCGKCCIKYSNGGLSASEVDIEGWELFNPEIYRFVKNGEIWIDPVTGQPIELCPWLREQPAKGNVKPIYTCDIYLDRPEDCRHYPSTIDEMVRDGCEMIEVKDLNNPTRAQRDLDRLMSDSRPPLG
jgi:uncharacterized protein